MKFLAMTGSVRNLFGLKTAEGRRNYMDNTVLTVQILSILGKTVAKFFVIIGNDLKGRGLFDEE